jgi:formimidoylglutamate deiminase
MQLLAPLALLPDGWAKHVLIEIDAHGSFVRVEPGGDGGDARELHGPVVPGMPNLHSHAFQRAMAGLTERRGPAGDSFWTWQKTMYGFLSRLSPEDIQTIATQVYVEMLEAGYTGVAEFHYLHHDPQGKPYDAITETSERIVAAAKQVGIFLTHLPVMYMRGGFDGAPLAPEQRRFANDAARFAEILDSLHGKYAEDADLRLGIALHSLRAVSPEAMREAIAHLESLDPAAPIHIHIAEQSREVEECIEWSGRRPVQWLLENAEVNQRWCLVHATHVDNDEIAAMAKCGAVVGICPTTEANLGDGIFPAGQYAARGGRFGIGSDSHVSVCAAEELRLLEYGQRLRDRRRAVLASAAQPSVGRYLYESAALGGARAMGVEAGALAPGARADMVILDPDAPALCGAGEDEILDAAIFSATTLPVNEVMAGGRTVVARGRHVMREEVFDRYARTIRRLRRDNDLKKRSP